MTRIILDANLALLLVIGGADRNQVGVHKRLRQFETHDLDRLLLVLSRYEAVVLTPNVLTETSNLMRQGKGALLGVNAVFLNLVQNSDEQYIASEQAAADLSFGRLGLTDASILHLMDDQTELLTVDVDLYLEALRRKMTATNFNHLRDS